MLNYFPHLAIMRGVISTPNRPPPQWHSPFLLQIKWTGFGRESAIHSTGIALTRIGREHPVRFSKPKKKEWNGRNGSRKGKETDVVPLALLEER